jgi:hypothetical protein
MALCPAPGRLRIAKYCFLTVIVAISLWVLAQDVRLDSSALAPRH